MQGQAHVIACMSARMRPNAGPKGGVVIDDVALRKFYSTPETRWPGGEKQPTGTDQKNWCTHRRWRCHMLQPRAFGDIWALFGMFQVSMHSLTW